MQGSTPAAVRALRSSMVERPRQARAHRLLGSDADLSSQRSEFDSRWAHYNPLTADLVTRAGLKSRRRWFDSNSGDQDVRQRQDGVLWVHAVGGSNPPILTHGEVASEVRSAVTRAMGFDSPLHPHALVAQWTEYRPPKLMMQARILPRALRLVMLLGRQSACHADADGFDSRTRRQWVRGHGDQAGSNSAGEGSIPSWPANSQPRGKHWGADLPCKQVALGPIPSCSTTPL